MKAALERLFDGGAVLCDGAMGTMLYACGIFINRCYDELNVTQPETVRSIHDDYVQAGAQLLETNTFGANALRLERFGLADRVRELNLAGVRLARQAADAAADKQGAEVLVAGAIGPLGLRLVPAGELTPEAARAAYAEQIAALRDGGVDLLIAETVMAIDEAEQLLRAARETAPELPIAVLVTVDEQGRCLDGTPLDEAARRLEAGGARALGANCSSGPATVLQAIEKLREATSLSLAAMPNAGLPRDVDGRHIYLSSPEYMASFARKALRAGAQWVGGCCGTTPAHIRAMRGALRTADAQRTGEARAGWSSAVADSASSEDGAVEPAPLEQRSRLGAKIARGEWLTLVEVVPPRGIDAARELAGAELLSGRGVDAINVPDSPRASARMSAASLCVQIQQRTGLETVLHYTCRDRNLLSIQSDLLGAASLGLRNVLCLTGDPPKMGGYPDATAVFDVDAIGLTSIVRSMNHGLDIGRHALGVSTGFTIGVAANPGVPDVEHEVRRFRAKVQAGAEYCITQPVFDMRLLREFLERVREFRIPVIAGIWPLTSLRNAEFMRNELRVSMPAEVMERMAGQTSKEGALAEGVRIAQEMLAGVRDEVQGVQVSAPFSRFAIAAEVLGL